MSNKTFTVTKEGKVCDICNEPIVDKLHLYWNTADYSTKISRGWYFVFKTMYKEGTGKTYDAHGQCVADILSDYIENGEIRAKSRTN